MLKKLKLFFGSLLVVSCFCFSVKADEYEFEDEIETIVQTTENQNNTESRESVDEELADQVSVAALNDYDMSGSLFEKITLLEQDKVVLQLEKERAQLDLELERLNAEKLKLQMELDTLSGRAEHQQQELEVAKAQLEAQAESLKRQKENLDEAVQTKTKIVEQQRTESGAIRNKYKLVNISGVGNQLQATIEDISSGQNKRIVVGKELDGYRVKSISLNEGIVFEKDGVSENLNIGK